MGMRRKPEKIKWIENTKGIVKAEIEFDNLGYVTIHGVKRLLKYHEKKDFYCLL